MASATGVPAQSRATLRRGEDEPLLGRAGDASQREGKPLYHNLVLGTGVIAQVGVWILAGVIWGSIFSHQLTLFSAHPLLNSAGLLLIAQGALILQPTHTPLQKRHGTYAHAIINGTGLAAFIAGLVVILINKRSHNGTHFESPHAILGLIVYILLVVQTFIGFTQYFVPQVYGGIENAKKIWKYHRMLGYVIFIIALCTVAAATQTDYNKYVLHIQLWAVVVAAVFALIGILPRIKKQKLGL